MQREVKGHGGHRDEGAIEAAKIFSGDVAEEGSAEDGDWGGDGMVKSGRETTKRCAALFISHLQIIEAQTHKGGKVAYGQYATGGCETKTSLSRLNWKTGI